MQYTSNDTELGTFVILNDSRKVSFVNIHKIFFLFRVSIYRVLSSVVFSFAIVHSVVGSTTI